MARAALKLTWYAGSVLPYASLWHVVHRLAWLNALEIGELPYSATQRIGRSEKVVELNLLDNRSHRPVDLIALAQWMGEPIATFLNWSNLGTLPLRFQERLFTKHPRLCGQCLAGGYHSALTSLTLLKVCPIHGEPLRDACVCHQLFSSRMSVHDFRRPGSCECGRTRFFTPQTCRQPTVTAQQTQAFNPVIGWLVGFKDLEFAWEAKHTLGQVIRLPAGQHDSTVLLRRWSQEWALPWPQVFDQDPHDQTQGVEQAHDRFGALISHESAGACVKEPPRRGGAPRRLKGVSSQVEEDDGQSWFVLKAIARYLRHHVIKRPRYWVRRQFEYFADPLVVAECVRDDPDALLAFAYLLWIRIVAGIPSRRKKHRQRAGMGFVDITSNELLCSADVPNRLDKVPPDSLLSETALWRWVRCHVVASVASAGWQRAFTRALIEARSVAANWELKDEAVVLYWSVKRGAGSTVHYKSLAWEDAKLPGARCRTSKLERSTRVQASTPGPEYFQGQCLSWSPQGDWQVKPAQKPCSSRVDRHTLLGVRGCKPRFWLYACDSGYVARLCAVAIQCEGPTPKQAIEHLRQASRLHVVKYGIPVEERAPPMHPVALLKARDENAEYREYQDRVMNLSGRLGFWTASMYAHPDALQMVRSRLHSASSSS